MRSIKILGSGPSGLSAAINLAKAGREVEVFERGKGIGSRFYGDLEGLENWSDRKDARRMLDSMNIEINFNFSPFHELTVSNGSRTVSFSLEKPAFYLVKRGSVSGSLDRGLEKQALDLGVDIHFGETIPEGEASIVATGPTPEKAIAIVKGSRFSTEMEDTAVAVLGDRIAYKGYSYLLVRDGYGCMCSVVFDELEKVAACFRRTKKIFSDLADLDIRNPQRVGGIGNFSAGGTFERDGRLYVGEAAGIQDFLWGFGIKNAIISGFLAAKCLIENENYEKIAREYFEDKLKASLTNRFLWETFCFKDYSFILDVLGCTDDITKLFFSFHNFNFLQRALYPFASNWLGGRYRNPIL
ncbi:hypothetical protein AKJ40_00215 [candidate division MSBL1 archaeon SCGC-AAA259M10]|uniref:FAD/NAD(P)-binding domain-containing protein n=4 Tax=candidate division MSBL1 TaxID=215777 RepID=A0A656YXM2_9EURY|nr:hypothetical protein AKJ66_00275 [candidate division MSBL1 archaeon SCGC-AAA259E22]KXA95435.1 hypothetical protein AKJ36_00615 [candidate division MSBL1 archaeon SCGC-AAA259I07]KXA98697.1 hypothetical protein AKJ39_01130 [candidate division MSBL1 archaeon SCGC-AAA259J03]KXB00894.1 hypothetical protein AKJ40_00215 [candidate division MSBL1 archaeon SCGC-AAA259M10]